MIVKPTVNELLKHAENRYALVIETSKRARQITKGSEKLTDIDDKSAVTIAANEIAEGKVAIVDGSVDNIEETESNEELQETREMQEEQENKEAEEIEEKEGEE